ncbi:MAG: hypothetical protein H7X92_02360 [Chitinophagales bacterium]|nr:hypothetical protein [Hyphomicrobiales bacterium]
MYEKYPIAEIQRDLNELKNDIIPAMERNLAEALYEMAKGIGKNTDIIVTLLAVNLLVSIILLLIVIFN